VATGALNSVVPEQHQKLVENVANAATLAIGIYQLLERVVDAKVVEIKYEQRH
jgi:hypothetical protein